MTFVVMGLGTVFNALTNRRDPASGLAPPLLKALAISLFPLAMVVLATELPGLQDGPAHRVAHRPAVAARASASPRCCRSSIETGKWIRRRRAAEPGAPSTAQRALAPQRADPEALS